MEETELKRIEEVRKYLNVDYTALDEFKQITSLASQLCETPIALITLLDDEINWIMAPWGVDQSQAPRATSFCQYTVQQDDLFIINDAARDPRFDNNPLVHDNPKVRFYAGAPLKLSSGYNIGTLCLFDFEPRDLTKLQQTSLITLSRQIVYLLELKVSRQELLDKVQEVEEKNESLRQIAQLQSHEIRQPLASILGLVYLVKENIHKVDQEWLEMLSITANLLDEKIHAIVNQSLGKKDLKLLQFNKAVEEIEDYAILLLDADGTIENWNYGAELMKGYKSAEIVGKKFSSFYTSADRQKKLPEFLLEEARKNNVARNTGWRVRKNGTQFWASVVITAIHNEKKEVIGFLKVTRDLTNVRITATI